MKNFLEKNKVFLLGLFAAIILPANELIQSGVIDFKVILFAVGTAGLSFLARNLRGQWASIAGALGSTFSLLIVQLQTGEVQWAPLVSALLVQIMAIFLPPAKSIGYEQASVIKDAKEEGERSIPTSAPPAPTTL